MNEIYNGGFAPEFIASMLKETKRIPNIRVATDEGPGPKLALSEGGSR